MSLRCSDYNIELHGLYLAFKPNRMRKLLWFALILFTVKYANAQDLDTLYLQSGFKAYGDITNLEYGKISLETALFGTVESDMEDIKSIYTPSHFDVVTTKGYKYLARLEPSTSNGHLLLITETDTLEIQMEELYSLTPITNELRNRIKINILAGLNYAKATENLQINWGFDINYRSYLNIHSLIYDGLYTENPLGAFRRQNLVYNYGRNFNKGLYLFGAAELQSNTQLQLLVRAQAALGGGKNFLQNRDKLFALVIALNSNNEKPLEGEGFSSIEGLIGYRFRHGNLFDGKMNITSNLSYFTSITNQKRRRVDADFRLTWKIYGDFALSATYFSNYDSRVVQTGNSLNDYAITLSASYRL